MKKNYKSDFDVILRLKTCAGGVEQDVGWPDYDWVAKFYTSSRENVFIASNVGGSATNCFNDNGNIHIVFDNHGLNPGVLKVEFYTELPNNIYPDGSQLVVSPQSLDVELVRGLGDCGTIADVQLLLPYIKGEKGDIGPIGPQGEKGEPFTYDDFTPSQIEELKKPATEAAAALSKFQETAEQQESERVSAEEQREASESERKEQFAAWDSIIESKADKSELSNVFAAEPLTPENFPGINTYTREELKMDLLIDQWNSAWGIYGKYDPANAPDSEHPFMGNEIWMTYKEAICVMNATQATGTKVSTQGMALISSDDLHTRTVRPIRLLSGSATNLTDFAGNNKTLEVVRFLIDGVPLVNNLTTSFFGCTNLRKIIGPIILMSNAVTTVNDFWHCYKLEEIQIQKLTTSIFFKDCPLLSFASIRYIVANAANTSAITITVHPDVYAKLTDESNTEWNQILTDAAAKNITFATV